MVVVKKPVLIIFVCILFIFGCMKKPNMVSVGPVLPEIDFELDMVLVQSGSFTMGNSNGIYELNELPLHNVTVSNFFISKFEITQEQYGQVKSYDSSFFKYDTYPVEQVTWYEAVSFCNKLSLIENLEPCYNLKTWDCNFNKNGYRLPTEAEWEFAARGGTQSEDYKYSGGDNLNDIAWYILNSGEQPHVIGTKQPNELGLHDMTGNVWEWCWDRYDSEYYSTSPENDPKGPVGPLVRVFRGGSWQNDVNKLRLSQRSFYKPDSKLLSLGFRVARSSL